MDGLRKKHETEMDDAAHTIAMYLRRSPALAQDGPGETVSLDALDSVEMLELIQFLESTFRIRVEDAEVRPENFETVAAVARYVEAKRRNGN
jgi:acyl carrier protein